MGPKVNKNQLTLFRYAATEQPDGDNNDIFKNKEIVVTLPGKDVRISKKEYQVFAPFQENEKIMRLLTGQLTPAEKPEAPAPTQPTQPQDQTDILSKLLQNNPGLQNLNNIAEVQNLMNSQLLQNLNPSQPTQPNTANLMSSMMNLPNQGNMGTALGGNQTQNIPMNTQNPNEQLLSNLMNSNPLWNVGQTPLANPNFNSMDNKSLNDLINSQMMNFNANFMNGQDQNQNNNN